METPISILKTTASASPDAPAFKIPEVDSSTGKVQDWIPISYLQFWKDVQRCSGIWSRTLSEIPPKSVIGLWFLGSRYMDVVHIYSVILAGYIPQLISFLLPNPDVIYDLLGRSEARAMICAPSLRALLGFGIPPLPIYLMKEVAEIASFEGALLLDGTITFTPDDIAIIHHTSGTTSGTPKLVPHSYRWINHALQKAPFYWVKKKEVMTWLGSVCHVAQNYIVLISILYGTCIIQPTRLDYDTEELMTMIQRCGVTRLYRYASYLSLLLREARSNPHLLGLLKNLDSIMFGGLPLPKEDEAWGLQNGLNLLSNFGSTEVGIMFQGVGGIVHNTLVFKPLPPCDYAFVPIDINGDNEAKLQELVVLSSSGDCPDVSFRSSEDGHFHTGDLFEEITPGFYLPRGRNDDWIKLSNSCKCDAR